MSEFIRPFDGSQREVPPSERARVAKFFIRQIDGLFTEHFDDIVTSSKKPNDEPTQRLDLDLEIGGRAIYFELKRKINTKSDSDLYTDHYLEIAISKKTNASEDISHYYQLTPDGVQRRDARFGKNHLPCIDEENKKLERMMGVNDQSIGFTEIADVLELAKKASIPPVTFNDVAFNHDSKTDDIGEEEDSEDAKLAARFFNNFIDDIYTEKEKDIVSLERDGQKSKKLSSIIHSDDIKLTIGLSKKTRNDGTIERTVGVLSEDPHKVTRMLFRTQNDMLISSAKSTFTDGGSSPLTEVKVGIEQARELRRFLKEPTI
jgi:hypothetical protein